jgi:hypothetical protein
MDRDRQICLEAGMNDHLAKPIDPDALLVRAQMDPARNWTSPAQTLLLSKTFLYQRCLPFTGDSGDRYSNGTQAHWRQSQTVRSLLSRFADSQANANDIRAALDASDRVDGPAARAFGKGGGSKSARPAWPKRKSSGIPNRGQKS